MNGLCVLLVEDEAHLLEMTAEMLEMHGVQVRRALNAQQALSVLETYGAPDLLITDHAMPGQMTGLELIARVRGQWPALKAVLVSGFAPAQLPPIPSDVSYLPKPYRVKHLLELLEPLTGGAAPQR